MSSAVLWKQFVLLSKQLANIQSLVAPNYYRLVAAQTRPFSVIAKSQKSESDYDKADIFIADCEETPLPVNFDYAKVKKKLYHEDGIPDVLYRRVEVKCLAHESPLLDSYQSFVEMAMDGLNIPVQVEEPCRVVERKTVLRSAFVHKDIRTQYEWYTFYRLFKFTHLTGSTADTLLEYLQRNMPEGMAMEVTKTRVERLPEGVEAAKGETPTKEDAFGGRKKYAVDTIKPRPKPDPAKMPDDWDPHSRDERFEPIPV